MQDPSHFSDVAAVDSESILRTLDDPPAGLAELRGVLLRVHE